MAKIKEKKSTKAVKEKVDNKKERISTKILISFVVGVMLLLLAYAIKKVVDCGLSDCYLGGAGAGSLIVTLIWLFVESLKP
ncbi:hypothetical protein GOV13_04065 [Candidatus Pacearchaeota archaeon]|nr:hypothetical protein [Candidatus Pacearchaeota archaeon]